MPRAGKTSSRGYGRYHQALRKAWAPYVATGQVTCSRCPDLIQPGQPWELDHTDDRTGYLGPAHKRCNQSAGAHKRHGQRALAADPTPKAVTVW